jgi:signal transduction histidine kinase
MYMESIFLNLLTNAIKYARPGIEPQIKITTRIEVEQVILEVEDNGMGFDMEKVKDKIFGLHQNFHNHADSKGVGLYLVHSHVTNLGGNIQVESEPDKGTKFKIMFAKQP